MNEVRLETARGMDSCLAQFEAMAESVVSGGLVAALVGAYAAHVRELVVLRISDTYLRDASGKISMPIFHNACAMFLGSDPCRYVGMAMAWDSKDDAQYAFMQSTHAHTDAYMQVYFGPGQLGPKREIMPGSHVWDYYEPVYERLKMVG